MGRSPTTWLRRVDLGRVGQLPEPYLLARRHTEQHEPGRHGVRAVRAQPHALDERATADRAGIAEAGAAVQVVSLVVVDRSFVAANARELARMRAVVSRLSDRQLGAMVNEYWSVAGVLGHIAFWDGRALYLAGKLERGEPSAASENEPEDVDWINDSSRPLIHAIPPRALAELAVSIAEATDELVASLPDEMLAGLDETSALNPVRANHRGEHLDEIEAAIRPRT